MTTSPELMNDQAVDESAAQCPILETYAPPGASFDELLQAQGTVRPHWQPFLNSLAGTTVEQLEERDQATARVLREHGAIYDIYSDPDARSRPWSLDSWPLILPQREWQHIEQGLIQRARLLNLVLADIYGPQQLLRHGLVPPALLFANPGFLTPCHGLRPREDVFVFFYAVDMARGPDGRWTVLCDYTTGPSGAGYVLENRLVLSRVIPDQFRACEVQRLGGFYSILRDSLRDLSAGRTDSPRVVLLTPGPHFEGYVEQVFLARQLGFPLVEGGDLTVRDRRVFIKTVGGLQPVDVILRRVKDALCDPLELHDDSTLGVPGLVEAARAGNVTVANALGAAAVEMPAWLAFLPGLAKQILGEPLILPNVQTWWCGQVQDREEVAARSSELVLRRAFAPGPGEPLLLPGQSEETRRRLLSMVEREPHAYIAQEETRLGTAPVWEKSRLVSQPMLARFFVCASGKGYTVMPGAFTRYSESARDLISSIQAGVGSKDTWVPAEEPDATHIQSQLPFPVVLRTRLAADVPSRVADNLFWLGRYSERLEDSARINRCVLMRLVLDSGAEGEPGLLALVRLLERLGILSDQSGKRRTLGGVEREIYQLVYHAHRLGTLREVSGRLRGIAFTLRERFSADTWSVLGKLEVRPRFRSDRPQATETLSLLNEVILHLAAFSGLEMENMTRGIGWQFLDLGRRMERAINIVSLAQTALTLEETGTDILEPILEIADSVMTYRNRYFAAPQWPMVLDLLLLDETNPRSLRFQVDAMATHAMRLPGEGANGPALPQILGLQNLLHQGEWQERLALEAQASRDAVQASLAQAGTLLRELSDSITQLYFSHAETRVN